MVVYEKMHEMGHDDKDGDEKDEQVESLSRNVIIKTVEFVKINLGTRLYHFESTN